MSVHFKENAKYLLTLSLFLSVLTLITFNIQNISLSKQVLGLSAEVARDFEKEKLFWEKFLGENPNYLAGWLELGKIEEVLGNPEASIYAFSKAEEIDPNWQIR